MQTPFKKVVSEEKGRERRFKFFVCLFCLGLGET